MVDLIPIMVWLIGTPTFLKTVLSVKSLCSLETGSLAAAARIVSLRDQDDAQKEIRDLAIMLAKEVKNIAPVSWKALTNAHWKWHKIRL